MSAEITGVGPTQPSSFSIAGDASPNVLDSQYLSTLSSSEQESIGINLGAGFPQLEMILRDGESKAIDALLDGWIKNLEEQANRIREEQMSPAFRAWMAAHSSEFQQQDSRKATLQAVYDSPSYHNWIQSLPEADRIQEMSFQRQENLRSNIIDGVSSYLKESREDASFMTAGLVIAVGMVAQIAMIDIASTSMVGANPISDAPIRAMAIMPPDLASTLNLSINLFAMGMVYHSVADVMANNDKPADMRQTAEAFAKEVLDKVQGNQINGFVMALVVNKFENGQPVTPQRAEQLANIAKVTMLMVGLASLYEHSVGWRSGAELLALLNGNMRPRSELEGQMVAEINRLLATLPEETQNDLKTAFSDYMDHKPQVPLLMDVKRSSDRFFEFVPNPVVRE